MNALAMAYSSRSAFALVYLQEAHAADEWPLGRTPALEASQSLDQRAKHAWRFREEAHVTVPVFLDSIDGDFQRHFAAWPERFYVVSSNGLLSFIAQPRHGGYDHESVFARIERFLSSLAA